MNKALLRSMTGYGDGELECNGARIRAELRTVNHRYLNLQFRTPPGYDRHTRALEGTLKERFTRGHVGLTLTVEPAAEGESRPVRVDLERARAYLEGIREMGDVLGLEGEVGLPLLAGFRDLFRSEDPSPPEVAEEALLAVVSSAADRALAMREEEGARLGDDLRARLDAMEAGLTGIEARAPARLVEERDRLRERIRELMDGVGEVDEERIAREIAHLADRWDIHEEVVRFRSHTRMFRDTLDQPDPAGVGKRLGFIAQEILREANTVGSKANDTEIAAWVVKIKEEIERLREQLENLE
jgi:uncharacterized protein (TIGR00255 family)